VEHFFLFLCLGLKKNMFALVTTLATLSLFEPRVTLPSGQRVSLHGRGPPVLFSSGLYGLMPHRIYTQLFQELRKDVTMVVLDDARRVTARVAEEVCDALAVDSIGFFSHSSFDAGILTTGRVRAAVLCDPVVLLPPPLDGVDFPVAVLRAGNAYGDPAIPAFLAPPLGNAGVASRDYEGMGHADLLDDPWAALGPQVLPWMKGAMPSTVPFAEWRFRRNDLTKVRAAYRKDVARRAVALFTGGEKDDTSDLLTEEAA
jgi:hypothetical protein